jgi:hypothetical protein
MSDPTYPSNPVSKTPSDQSPAGDVIASAQEDLAAAAQELKGRAAEIGHEAKEQAGELVGKAKGMANEQKDLLAGQLGGVSEALQNAASELEGRQQSGSQYVRMIADGADRLTTTLRDKDVDQILEAAQQFGRRQPVAFLGFAALLGFAASRFVTASAARRHGEEATDGIETTSTNDPYQAPDYGQSVGGRDAGL